MFACAMLAFVDFRRDTNTKDRIEKSQSPGLICSMLHYFRSSATNDTSTYLSCVPGPAGGGGGGGGGQLLPHFFGR